MYIAISISVFAECRIDKSMRGGVDMAVYFCTCCGATLNQQGFDPAAGIWTCQECGMLLMDAETYEMVGGVAWYCDNGGALMNKLDGFTDVKGWWRCTECGHINGTAEADMITSDTSRPCLFM